DIQRQEAAARKLVDVAMDCSTEQGKPAKQKSRSDHPQVHGTNSLRKPGQRTGASRRFLSQFMATPRIKQTAPAIPNQRYEIVLFGCAQDGSGMPNALRMNSLSGTDFCS